MMVDSEKQICIKDVRWPLPHAPRRPPFVQAHEVMEGHAKSIVYNLSCFIGEETRHCAVSQQLWLSKHVAITVDPQRPRDFNVIRNNVMYCTDISVDVRRSRIHGG